MTIVLKNGSEIALKGADKPDTLRGVALHFVVLDEFQDMKPDTVQVLRPTLSSTRGGALIIGTPKASPSSTSCGLSVRTKICNAKGSGRAGSSLRLILRSYRARKSKQRRTIWTLNRSHRNTASFETCRTRLLPVRPQCACEATPVQSETADLGWSGLQHRPYVIGHPAAAAKWRVVGRGRGCAVLFQHG